ncbi:MAG: ABC transporter permease [Clostridiales bacterium]|jgi:peptide/nickel transport system permease protein|nr:ABC transporter permease [Clostridiales bacterium]
MNPKKKFFSDFILKLKSAAEGLCGFFKKLIKHKKGRAGLCMLAVIALIAALAPLLTPYDPYDYDAVNRLLPPSGAHWLGTDKNGVDILTQLIYGTRVSLVIGSVTGVSVTVLGAVLGVAAGYFGKTVSALVLNIINVLMVIPTLPLMIILNKVSSSYVMMIFIFTAFGWAGTARVVRAQTLGVVNMNYVKQAELAGAGKAYIMRRHILPAVSHLLIMNCALSCAGFMIAEAGLSFIGLGDPSAISWGKILVGAEESAFSSGLWAWILAPGAAIFITVTAFMQIGYAIEDIFNPKMRSGACDGEAFGKLEKSEIERLFDGMNDMTQERASEIYDRYESLNTKE